MHETDRTETSEECQAEQLAYYAWVDEARKSGHNREPDIFRAGWAAGRDYARASASRHE